MPSRHVAALTVVLLSTLALFGACNGQGEGEICNTLNGNNDCRNGYECRVTQLGANAGARCCPVDVALATTVACGLQQGGNTDASTAAPSDASLAEEDATTSADVVEDAASSDGGDGG